MRREPALALPRRREKRVHTREKKTKGESESCVGLLVRDAERSSYQSLGIRSVASWWMCAFCFYFFLVCVGVRYIFLFLASGVVGHTYF